MLYRSALGLALLCTGLIACGVAEASDDFQITYENKSTLTLDIEGNPPVSAQSEGELSRSVVGTESNQCNTPTDGRRSSSSGRVSSSAVSRPDGYSASFSASLVASGGHYTSCVAGCDPIFKNCLGFLPHDTSATGEASSFVRAQISFGTSVVQTFYDLTLTPSQPSAMSISLTNSDGKVVPITQFGRPTRLQVKPGDTYFLNAAITVSTTNQGECCSDAKTMDAQLKVRLERSPILSSHTAYAPYIPGGSPTPPGSYKYVVALLIDGRLHCTGTLIGKRTVLTAAHCIDGFEDQIASDRMSVIIGQDVNQPTAGPISIISGTYPRGADPYQYNPETYAHDIGVAIAKVDVPAAPQKIHLSTPSWSQLINKVPLTFVGYGFTITNAGELISAGILREAPWEASQADDWRFYYKASGSGTNTTCSGDSGGPAFYQDSQTLELLVVGVTSGGDPNCKWGADTRVDAHHEWILAHIQ